MSFPWLRTLWPQRDSGPSGAAFDARHGIDAGASVDLDRLTIGSESRRFGERYQPSEPGVLIDTVKYIGLDPAQHRFIDLGCGKGRMLIVAAELGFRSCVGVEFATELAQAARRNAAAAGFRNISVIHGDAGAYGFAPGRGAPKDEPLVLYLFNPFSAEIMTRVRDNLARLPRANYTIIYKNARERAIFDALPTLRYLGSPPRHGGLWGTHVWVPKS